MTPNHDLAVMAQPENFRQGKLLKIFQPEFPMCARKNNAQLAENYMFGVHLCKTSKVSDYEDLKHVIFSLLNY